MLIQSIVHQWCNMQSKLIWLLSVDMGDWLGGGDKINLLNRQAAMEESIYNIIPKDYQDSPKQPLYKSKYPYDIPPTGSTFCHLTTSRPGVSNLSGEWRAGLQAHTEYGDRSTLGYLKNDRKPSPEHFIKKHTGTMGSNSLPPVRNFYYDCVYKKDSVPKRSQKPAMGLRSGKDFVVTNAIENILSSARKLQQPTNWLQKKTFGKVPQYLQKIKDSIHQEYRMIQSMHEQNEPKRVVLSPEEVDYIRDGLKRKWDEINHQYQQMTHLRLIDTTGLRRRKQNYESELKQIEDDIKKLNKAYIFVE